LALTRTPKPGKLVAKVRQRCKSASVTRPTVSSAIKMHQTDTNTSTATALALSPLPVSTVKPPRSKSAGPYRRSTVDSSRKNRRSSSSSKMYPPSTLPSAPRTQIQMDALNCPNHTSTGSSRWRVATTCYHVSCMYVMFTMINQSFRSICFSIFRGCFALLSESNLY